MDLFKNNPDRRALHAPFDIIGDPIQLASSPNDLFSADEIISSLNMSPTTIPFAQAIQELKS